MIRANLLLAALCLAFAAPAAAAPRLYWFVPDGLRADPKVVDLYGWARDGHLPNIKRMMERGSWGYSMPAFPSHTPSNFATLMTGSYPETHGVADGPMRVEGFPLLKPSVNGFASTAKKVAPVWRTLEKAGRKVALVSIPGSTPPELDAGATVRGRWGNWGADFHALNFESAPKDGSPRKGSRLFYLGPELTRQVALKDGAMEMPAYGASFVARADGDEIAVSIGKAAPFARLKASGDWSEWTPVTLKWQDLPVETRVRACLIKRADGYMKVRLLFDVMNRTIVSPASLAGDLGKSVGPMVDFPDNWPAQLNRLPEERGVMLAEAKMALDWHRRAAARLLSVEKPDALIQDTYVPNQVLESRWWLKHIDPGAPAFAATPEAEREARRAELLEVYKGIDAVLGEALDRMGPNDLVVLSSDHGVLPIKREVLLNNLLAKEGLLVYGPDSPSGEPEIDWSKSKAAFLKMIGVYINPSGLAGPWTRAKGKEYDALRAKVEKILKGLKHDGKPVVDRVVRWEKAGELRLPTDRVPDLILAMKPGYALTEDMDRTGEVLRESVQSGYKQAVLSGPNPALWTPFIVVGPGVKKGHRLSQPVHNADQAPTLLKLMGVALPPEMSGKPIAEMIQ